MAGLRDSRKSNLLFDALEVGLTLTTYTPGRITRYRFSKDIEADYSTCKPIHTAVGIKAAESFLEGYRAALCYFNIEAEM